MAGLTRPYLHRCICQKLALSGDAEREMQSACVIERFPYNGIGKSDSVLLVRLECIEDG